MRSNTISSISLLDKDNTLQRKNLTTLNKTTLAMIAIMFASLFISCKKNTEKELDAREKVEVANNNLDSISNEVKKDSAAKANDAEWQTFKAEANKTIAENESRIMELKKAMQKPGNTFDDAYKKSIIALEEKNTALKTKIDDYEDNQTDWDTFKREFDSDIKGIGSAFKDLTVNNKK